jgi:hypothetical protein
MSVGGGADDVAFQSGPDQTYVVVFCTYTIQRFWFTVLQQLQLHGNVLPFALTQVSQQVSQHLNPFKQYGTPA